MNKKICIFTICTLDFLANAQVSLDSAIANIICDTNTIDSCIVLVDSDPDKKIPEYITHKIISAPDSLFVAESMDRKRWKAKPYYIKSLLSKYDTIIYIDTDIYFVNNCSSIIDEIHSAGILLTKHNRPILPNLNSPFIFNQFLSIFTEGFFNAGFIGACKKGSESIDWWNSVVQWNCSKDKCNGLYDDQKYLDILALQFNEQVKISNNYGYNVSHWNIFNPNITNSKHIFYHFSGNNKLQQINNIMYDAYCEYIDKVNKLKNKNII
jgi:hypothetical protein